MTVRHAVLADIHGNLEAFEAVLRDLDALKPERILVLGDTINYGPDPGACLERACEVADVLLFGNHETEAIEPTDRLESHARAVLDWTVEALADCPSWHRLVEEARAQGFKALAHGTVDGLELVHGTPREPVYQYLWPGHDSQYVTLNSQIDERLRGFLEEFTETHGFCAHTHVPAVLTAYDSHPLFDPVHSVIVRNGTHTFVGPTALFFVPEGPATVAGLAGHRAVINPGSVGQPRTLGDPAASYALYDGDRLELRRVPYEVWRTAAKVRQMAIADDVKEHLVRRLGSGV